MSTDRYSGKECVNWIASAVPDHCFSCGGTRAVHPFTGIGNNPSYLKASIGNTMIKSEELTNPNSCMSRAKPEEMTFVLLERDVTSPAVIRFWCNERISCGKNMPDDPQILEALACADSMERNRWTLIL